jgi:toxin ParE1/3/4
MQPFRVELRPEATADLAAIFRYVWNASKSAEAARRFTLRIRDRCERVGDAPHGGLPRDDLETGLRTVPFEKTAIIAYKIENECVWITNIFYGGRDFEAFYRGAPPENEPD